MSTSSKGNSAVADDRAPYPIIKLSLANNPSWGTDSMGITHFGILCDGPLCVDKNDLIQGLRYHCSVCPDNDFCETCVHHPNNEHDRTHALYECPGEVAFSDANKVVRHGRVPGTASTDLLDMHCTPERTSEVTAGLKRPFYFNIPADILRQPPGIQHHHDPKLLADIMLGRVTRYDYSQDEIFQSVQPGGPAVRLFDLQPGGNTDRLRITFRVAWLNDPPSYEALSYAWREGANSDGKRELKHEGDKSGLSLQWDPSYAVYVDDRYFIEVTIGLRYALRALRERRKVRTLFCDQLSINQSNLAEKSAQVQAMAAIYGHASNVIVWMGHQDEHTKPACALIEQLADRCNCADHLLPTPWDVTQDPNVPAPFAGYDPWVSLPEFFERLVFSRSWVIQEVTVARSVTVKCGVYELEWWKIANLARLLGQPAWATGASWEKAPPRRRRRLSGHVGLMNMIRSAFHNIQVAPWSLSELLLSTYTFQATDPCDKVFALLSICEQPTSHDEDERIKPDYTQSPIEIFTKTSKYIIKTDKSLDILEFPGISSMKGLPTWVADWTAPSQTYWTYNSKHADDPYQAAGDSEILIVWPDEDEPGLLATSSFPLGRVVEICDFADCERGVGKKLHLCATLASSNGERYPNGGLAADALMSTFRLRAYEFWSKRAVEPEEYRRAFAAVFLDHLLPIVEHTSTLGLQQIRDYLEEYESGKVTELAGSDNNNSSGRFQEICKHAETWLRGVCTDHVFFLMDNGYFGQAPPRTEIGDEVHIVSGGSLPFVVRRGTALEEGQCHHSLIGAAYVHGMMHGEALVQPESSWSELYLR